MHPQPPPLTIDGTVLKESVDLDILGVNLILSWPLRSILARFPEQLLKDSVSWGSPEEYSMIDCSPGDAFMVLSCQFWNTVLQCASVPYVLVRVTRGTLIAHRYSYSPPRCRTSQYRRTFILLSVSLWNDRVDSVFDGVGLAGFNRRSNAFLLA